MWLKIHKYIKCITNKSVGGNNWNGLCLAHIKSTFYLIQKSFPDAVIYNLLSLMESGHVSTAHSFVYFECSRRSTFVDCSKMSWMSQLLWIYLSEWESFFSLKTQFIRSEIESLWLIFTKNMNWMFFSIHFTTSKEGRSSHIFPSDSPWLLLCSTLKICE